MGAQTKQNTHTHFGNTFVMFNFSIFSAGSGYVVLPLIRKDYHTDHVVLQKKLQFPWKTDAFKGVVEVNLHYQNLPMQ